MELRRKHVAFVASFFTLLIITMMVFGKANRNSIVTPPKGTPEIAAQHLYFLSPHNDDTILTFGGLLLNTQGFPDKEKDVMVFFNVSNYSSDGLLHEKTEEHIRDTVLKRVDEDMAALSQVFQGWQNYTYTLYGEKDALLRGRIYPRGKNFSEFRPEDIKLYESIYERAKTILRQNDCAVFVPSAVGEHLDHFIVREAVVKAAHDLNTAAQCQIYFGEDQPYTGQHPKQAQMELNQFVTRLGLKPLAYPINVKAKIDLFVQHYHSQYKESYPVALKERAAQVKGEQIYLWPRDQYGKAPTDLSCKQKFCQFSVGP